jgi:hypothetical protein
MPETGTSSSDHVLFGGKIRRGTAWWPDYEAGGYGTMVEESTILSPFHGGLRDTRIFVLSVSGLAGVTTWYRRAPTWVRNLQQLSLEWLQKDCLSGRQWRGWAFVRGRQRDCHVIGAGASPVRQNTSVTPTVRHWWLLQSEL